MDVPRARIRIGMQQGDSARSWGGFEGLIVLTLGSPVPVAMRGKKAAMEERREECREDEG